MIDFNKLSELLKLKKTEENMPKHVIINLFPLNSAEEKKKEDFENLLKLITSIINLQIEKNIPIFTISLGNRDNIDETLLANYCETLLNIANEKKINISIFGRWYDLSGELVESLKKINYETKDFDNYFLNFCINYDGKQEICDACRVIIRKIYLQKENFDSITPNLIKENIYSSYFIPPDIIIEPGNKFSGTFLWDSVNSRIIFLNKEIQKILISDIEKSIKL